MSTVIHDESRQITSSRTTHHVACRLGRHCVGLNLTVKIESCRAAFLSVLLQWERAMPNVTLLYSATCSACPAAKRLFKELRVKYSFSYREIDITSPDGQELAERHSVRAVPATIIDGRLTFIGVPTRQSVEKAFELKMKQRTV
jgi:glutaredoxin